MDEHETIREDGPTEDDPGQAVLDCMVSLVDAIEATGGTLKRRVLTMSLEDFIVEVAVPKHIRFTSVPPTANPF